MSHVLVINAGSSSLKYQLIDPADGSWLAKGIAERIGQPGSRLIHESAECGTVEIDTMLADHGIALTLVLRHLQTNGPGLSDLVAVGHRCVQGGDAYHHPVVFDSAVEAGIERLIPLAPLHNPAALICLRATRRLLPDVPSVVVFDTAFHATIPAVAHTYALPADVTQELGIRRYGFHGISYRYVTRASADLLGVCVDGVNLIICHLGNGASVCAVSDGRSIDTSMGMTPLPGLVMGTRSGDIDPAVIFHLVRVGGFTLDDVDEMLNQLSGLKGLTGEQDMRGVRAKAESGDAHARMALDVYGHRLRSYIGSYFAALPRLHALVFTGGVGENDSHLRAETCGPLAHLGIRLDTDRNEARERHPRAIDDGTRGVRVLVVPTNEEAEIARDAARTASAA